MVESVETADVVAAIRYLARTGGPGALSDDEVASHPVLGQLAGRWSGEQVSAVAAEVVRQFLTAFIASTGDDRSPAGGGPKAMSDGNVVLLVGRMLRVTMESPSGIGRRRTFAVRGLNVSESVFRSDPGHNKFEQYMVRFATLAINFTNQERRSLAPVVQPHVTVQNSIRQRSRERLERLSQRLSTEIAWLHTSQHSTTAIGDLYVERAVELDLVQELQDPDAEPRVVVGEAGFGKTSLLWSMCNRLRAAEMNPLLVSATWLQRDSDGSQAVSADEVIDAISVTPRTVLLVDTADLLLHSRSARFDVVDLIERAARTGVPTVLSTRPLEARSLPADLARPLRLDVYNATSELPRAIRTLAATFCPNAVEDPVLAIMSARARGLLVDDVCRSPLLLRLLFDLSAPNFPRLELDVTGLYALFWERRITADLRVSGDETSVETGDDLSLAAGLAGIAILALGTPETSLDSMTRRSVEVARGYDPLTRPDVLARQLRQLASRGVLTKNETTVRFFHQTFFEYAAARGLASRGGEKELPRLRQHLLALPNDLFVAAVVEQLLIVLGHDPISKNVVAREIDLLIGSGAPGLVAAAVVVWAHHPGLLRPGVQILATLDKEALLRFVRTVSGVHGDAEGILKHLEWIWNQKHTLRTAIVDSLIKIGGRSPEAVATFIREVGLFECLAVEHADYLRANAEPQALLLLMARADPALGRQSISDVLEKIAVDDRRGKEAIGKYLRIAAENWDVVGNDPFLKSLEDAVDRIQSRTGDSDARVVRESLGSVVAARWLHCRSSQTWSSDWLNWVGQVCRRLDGRTNDPVKPGLTLSSRDQTPSVGAQMIAIGIVMSRLPVSDVSTFDLTFDLLLSLGGPDAPRQLARGCLAQLLITDAPARERAGRRLGGLMAGHLPADHNTYVPGDELWATVARSALWDSRIPPEVVSQTLKPVVAVYSGDNQLWTSKTYLVALAAAVLAAGHNQPLDDLEALATTGAMEEASREAINIFLDHARDRASDNPQVLVPLALKLARAVDRTGTIKDLLLSPSNHEQIRSHGEFLVQWVQTLLSGTDLEQSQGADLLRLLINSKIVRPRFARLRSWFNQLRDPAAKANLLTSMASVALRTDDMATANQFFSSIVVTTRDPEPKIEGPVGVRRLAESVIDAARDAKLEMLAFLPDASPDQWDEVYSLTFAPRLTGSKKVQITPVGNLSRFMTQELENGYLDQVITQLDETVRCFEQLSSTQSRTASNRMRVAVGALARRTTASSHEEVASIALRAPKQLKTQLIRGLLARGLSPDLERRLATHIPHRPEVVGIGGFREVLAPPTVSEPNDVSVTQPETDTESEVEECLHRFAEEGRRVFRTLMNPSRAQKSAARDLAIDRSTFARLKSLETMQHPGATACQQVDEYGQKKGYDFNMVGYRNDLLDAKDRAKRRNAQRSR